MNLIMHKEKKPIKVLHRMFRNFNFVFLNKYLNDLINFIDKYWRLMLKTENFLMFSLGEKFSQNRIFSNLTYNYI